MEVKKRLETRREKKLYIYLKLAQPTSLGYPLVSEVKGKTKWRRLSTVKMCLVRILFFLQALKDGVAVARQDLDGNKSYSSGKIYHDKISVKISLPL
jgi:hypothetical protein